MRKECKMPWKLMKDYYGRELVQAYKREGKYMKTVHYYLVKGNRESAEYWFNKRDKLFNELSDKGHYYEAKAIGHGDFVYYALESKRTCKQLGITWKSKRK